MRVKKLKNKNNKKAKEIPGDIKTAEEEAEKKEMGDEAADNEESVSTRFVWEDMVERHDFFRLENGGYKTVMGDIDICAYSVQGRIEILIPCASALVDDEGAIEKYLREEFDDMKNVTVSYGKRRLCITVAPEKALSDELLEGILDVIRKSDEKYDFLPACMHCGSVMPVVWDTDREKETPMAICEICRSAKQLQDKHEKIIQDQKEASASEYIVKRIPRRDTKSSIKAGIHGGFYASISGLVIVLISYLAPQLISFILFIPGAIAGVIASRDVNKLDQIGFAPKIVIAFISTFMTILVLSFLNLYVLIRVLNFRPTDYALGSVALYQLVMGIGTYAVTQIAYMFWLREY